MKKLLITALPVCIAIFFPAAVCADESMSTEEIIGELESIFQISDDMNRLESYDQFTASLGIAKEPVTVSEDKTTESKWEVSTRTDPMDDSKKIFFMLPAGSSTAYDQVVMFIRYQNGSTELFVAWDEYLSDNTRMTIRFGDNNPYTENWSKSADSTAVFCKNPVSFIQKIAEHDKLVLRITPYSEGPKTAVFDIRGLKDEVMPYNEDLGWF